MRNWAFNYDLFLNLSNVLDMSISEIARRIDIQPNVLNRYIQQDYVISVELLIKMCNALRMPLCHFIAEDGVSIIPERENATIRRDLFREVVWKGEEARVIFCRHRICWTEVAKAMGLTTPNAKNRFLKGIRFPVDDFFKTCTSLQLSPYNFILDGNSTAGEADAAPSGAKTKRKSAAEDVSLLRREVVELQGKVEALEKNYATLLSTFRQLAARFDASPAYLSKAAEPDMEIQNTRKDQ